MNRKFPYHTELRLTRSNEKKIKKFARSKDWSINKAINHILEKLEL